MNSHIWKNTHIQLISIQFILLFISRLSHATNVRYTHKASSLSINSCTYFAFNSLENFSLFYLTIFFNSTPSFHLINVHPSLWLHPLPCIFFLWGFHSPSFPHVRTTSEYFGILPLWKFFPYLFSLLCASSLFSPVWLFLMRPIIFSILSMIMI